MLFYSMTNSKEVKFRGKWITFLTVVLLMGFSIDLSFGQLNQNLRFTTVNHLDGLPNNTVNAIAMDDLGFIWIGTNDGLCRYEASSFVKVFKSGNPKIEGGLQSSNINALFLDSKKNLWIGTRLGGLTRFHQPTEKWTTFRNNKEDDTSLSNDEILTITEDSKGRIWIGTEDGLNVFNDKTNSFITFKSSSTVAGSLKGKAVLSVMEDDKGWIWVGTWAGALHLLILPENGKISEATFKPFLLNEKTESKHIWKIFQDKQKRHWVGTRGAGLFLMQLPPESSNLNNNLDWKPIFHNYVADGTSSGLLNDNLNDIFQDSKNNLYVATVYGLHHISADELTGSIQESGPTERPEFTFHAQTFQSDNPTSLTNNDVSTIFEDSQGLIWFGTFSGISRYNSAVDQFEVYDLLDYYVKAPNTQNLFIDSEDIAWIGNAENGILQFDFENSKILNSSMESIELVGDYAASMHSADDENLFIATNEGITKLNIKTNKVKHFPIPKHIKEKVKNFETRCLFKDKGDKIWVGSLQGLYVIDEASGIYTEVVYQAENPKSISDNAINQIFEDSNGDIWVATFSGLNKLIKEEVYEFERFKHNSSNPETSIASNRIICLEEINGTLYLGSGNGLISYDLKNKTFTNYSKENHKYSIQSIVPSLDGNLWASTTQGIFFFNTQKKTFNKYDKGDGLGDIVFQQGSGFMDKNGWVYFGSRRGITRFNPKNIAGNAIAPPVFITEIRKMGPKGKQTINGSYKNEIFLEHDEYFLSLDYAALNYNRAEKNQYAYKLEGFEDNWNYSDKQHSAIYTNLDHGEYTFRMKAANNDGVWNKEGVSLKIIKKPAIWETWWFKLGAFIFAFLIIYLGVKYYTKNINASNKALNKYNLDLNKEIAQRKIVEAALHERELHMESLVTQRTEELEIKNKEVKSLLANIQTRNEHLETEIAKRTKNLRKSNEELQRSNNDLEQFAYIASHDLQEPLRVVGNFIGLLKRRYKHLFDEEAFQYIDFAVDGVSRMSEQIKSILTFSRVSQNNIVLSKTNMNDVIEIKLHDLSQNIQEKNVQFKIEKFPEIICDRNLIKMVFHNLINNAIKFNKSETPLITIECKENSTNEYWQFSVKDNGIGIPKEFQEKIFEIFRRLHSKQEYEGTGIGLALCQKIVHRHGGNIWVESEIGQGTTFHFTIIKKPEVKTKTKNETLVQKMYN